MVPFFAPNTSTLSSHPFPLRQVAPELHLSQKRDITKGKAEMMLTPHPHLMRGSKEGC